MKKLAAIMLICIILLAACHPTPEKQAVVQKDMEQLIEKAQATPEPAGSAMQNQGGLKIRLGIPDAFIVNEAYSDIFTVSADAPVELPDTGRLPMAHVKPADFEQELITNIYNYLVGDTVMYNSDTLRSKKDIEETILMLQQELSSIKSGVSGTTQPANDTIEQINEAIEELKEYYEKAPESVEHAIGSSQLRTITIRDLQTGKEQKSYTGVNVYEYPMDVGGRGKYFGVAQNNTGSDVIIQEKSGGFNVIDTASRGAHLRYHDPGLLYRFCGIEYDPFAFSGGIVSITSSNKLYAAQWPSDAGLNGFNAAIALRTAEDFLKAVNVDCMKPVYIQPEAYITPELHESMIFASSDPEQAYAGLFAHRRDDDLLGMGYIISFFREVNGVIVTTDEGSSYVDDAWGKQWRYERLSISVCADGIYSVEWFSPHEITDVFTEDSALLPFSDIVNVFKLMFRVTHEPQDEPVKPRTDGLDSRVRHDYTIERAVLSLRRIMERDNVESGLLIPVWDFYGYETITYADGQTLTMPDVYSLLTINAVDGSIIDVKKGY